MPTTDRDNYLNYAVHGLLLQLSCEIPFLQEQLRQMLWPFEVDALPIGFTATAGQIKPYHQSEVLRYLSPSAVPVATASQMIELYQEGERFWMVDDRWGLAEINVMKGTWRSWVLPHPTLDPFRVFELAVLWPMAQLLRPKGLYMVPAVSVARGGSGIMLLSPFNLEGELRALIRAGYNLIGQRWTAVREEQGRIELLDFPGQIEREATPRLRDSDPAEPISRWVDLTAEFCGVSQRHAWCDAVLIVEPSRRPTAHIAEVAAQRSAELMRRAWPITELHPFRKHGQLPLKLSQMTRCCQVQLSRRPEDLLVLLDTARSGGSASATGASTAIASVVTRSTSGPILTLPSASLSSPPPPRKLLPSRLAM